MPKITFSPHADLVADQDVSVVGTVTVSDGGGVLSVDGNVNATIVGTTATVPVSGVILNTVDTTATIVNIPTVYARGGINDYPIAISGVVSAGITNTSALATAIATAIALPTEEMGSQPQLTVSDTLTQELLLEILRQIKISNMYLASISDMWIRKEDIDGT